MEKMYCYVRRALLLVLLCPFMFSVQGREVVNLNFGWRFHLGDLDAVPTAMPADDAAG